MADHKTYVKFLFLFLFFFFSKHDLSIQNAKPFNSVYCIALYSLWLFKKKKIFIFFFFSIRTAFVCSYCRNGSATKPILNVIKHNLFEWFYVPNAIINKWFDVTWVLTSFLFTSSFALNGGDSCSDTVNKKKRTRKYNKFFFILNWFDEEREKKLSKKKKQKRNVSKHFQLLLLVLLLFHILYANEYHHLNSIYSIIAY